MPKRKPVPLSEASEERFKPALTPEARENQLISLAMNVAEQQMRDGTASPQLIAHFLKAGSSKGRFEVEKLRKETELLEAKTESIKAEKQTAELYENALAAMRDYGASMFGNKNDYSDV